MNGSLQTAVKLLWMCVPSLSVRRSMSPDFMSYILCFQFDLKFSCSHIMFSSISAIVLQRQSGKVTVIGHKLWVNGFYRTLESQFSASVSSACLFVGCCQWKYWCIYWRLFRLLVQSPDVVKQLRNLSSPMGMFHVGLWTTVRLMGNGRFECSFLWTSLCFYTCSRWRTIPDNQKLME